MKIVVDLVVDNFSQIFEQVSQGDVTTPSRFVLNSITKELGAERFARRGCLEDYACTLIFAATEQNQLLLGHLGDGMALSVENGVSEVLSWPDNGEFTNETYFVTANDAVEHLRLSSEFLEVPRSIMLASDGAAVSLLRRSDRKVAPAVAKLCEWATSRSRKETNSVLKTNLKDMFCKKTIDDCSIAIMADPRAHMSLEDTEISH